MPLLTNTNPQGIVTLTLNRPQVHNAFDEELIELLTLQLQQLDADPQVRVVLLAANGKHFSAGADLNWMQRVARYSYEENLHDAKHLVLLMKTLHQLSKPTIAIVQGSAFGGGVGLVAACDIAIASPQAQFCLSEVKLGLVPSVISPYVVAAIGERAAHRYFLTAETFSAAEAQRLGLVHHIAADDVLTAFAHTLAQTLCRNSPTAIAATKKLLHQISRRPLDTELLQLTAECIADRRMSAEGQEGIAAFLAKRSPQWLLV